MGTCVRRLASSLCALPLGLMVVCGSPLTTNETEEEPDTVHSPFGITYRLTWTLDGAQETDSGWMVTNDLGYTIHVTAGWLTTYSVQLVPCPDEESGADAMLLQVLAPRSAHAGHGDVADPSAITTTYVEDLVDTKEWVLGPLSTGSQRYCQVHYLIGPAENGSQGLPEMPDMMDSSLYLEGTWGHPGAPATEPFVIQSTLAMGEMTLLYPPDSHGLEEDALVLHTDVSSATVWIQRDLGAMFDGVDFGTMDDLGLQKAVLQSTANGLKITVQAH